MYLFKSLIIDLAILLVEIFYKIRTDVFLKKEGNCRFFYNRELKLVVLVSLILIINFHRRVKYKDSMRGRTLYFFNTMFGSRTINVQITSTII